MLYIHTKPGNAPPTLLHKLCSNRCMQTAAICECTDALAAAFEQQFWVHGCVTLHPDDQGGEQGDVISTKRWLVHRYSPGSRLGAGGAGYVWLTHAVDERCPPCGDPLAEGCLRRKPEACCLHCLLKILQPGNDAAAHVLWHLSSASMKEKGLQSRF